MVKDMLLKCATLPPPNKICFIESKIMLKNSMLATSV